jgi:polyhydroxyalkanoate synthesis regulator phasin
VEEFVRRGEMTQDQATRLLEVLLARGERESRILAQRVVGELFRLLERIPLVTRRELEELERRVRSLEADGAAEAPEEVEPSTGG